MDLEPESAPLLVPELLLAPELPPDADALLDADAPDADSPDLRDLLESPELSLFELERAPGPWSVR